MIGKRGIMGCWRVMRTRTKLIELMLIEYSRV